MPRVSSPRVSTSTNNCRVVSDDGGPERFRQALVRALAAVVEIWAFTGAPALICSLLSARGKRLGDVFAGTFVLQERLPRRRYLILEGRERIGGTWDLFRYPGVRSDSDMYTLGFPFRPWPSDQSIVQGGAIRDYVEATAREAGIFERIRFGQRATRASWSSADSQWTVETEGATVRCAFFRPRSKCLAGLSRTFRFESRACRGSPACERCAARAPSRGCFAAEPGTWPATPSASAAAPAAAIILVPA